MNPKQVDHAPEEILCPQQIFDIDFHPSANVICAGMIDGVVQLYQYEEKCNKQVLSLKHHQDSCRCVRFSMDGQSLFTGSSDKSLRCVDTSGGILWAELNAHESPINSILGVNSNIIASGDDNGIIKLWDIRNHRSIATFEEHKDYISDMISNEAGNQLLATSGDGSLSVYDLRKNIVSGHSDDLDDELLSICILKNEKKVVCGSQDGVLVIFSFGTWGDMSDRFPGHPDSIECCLKIDEDTICTGSIDGIIRIVQIHPNKLLGLIGDHEDFPVEVLKLSHDKKFIGSVSHANKVHFWDVGYLYEEEEEEEEEEVEEKKHDNKNEITSDNHMMDTNKTSSDDSDDDSDEDMDIYESNRRKTLPNSNELFFSDL